MAQQITDAEIEERTHLLELVKISTEVFSRQQYERLKELSNKMFASAGSPHIAKENTKHMAEQTIEKVAKEFYSEQSKCYEDGADPMFDISRYLVVGFIDGAKCQEERMLEIMDAFVIDVMGGCTLHAKEWFEQHKI